MRRSERLMALVLELEGRPAATVAELAEAVGASRRTTLRDLQALSTLGVPLASRPGPHGGYQLVRDRVLPPVSFTVDEATALFFAQQALEDYGTLPVAAEARVALHKLYRAMAPAARHRVDRLAGRLAFVSQRRSVAHPHLAALLAAALEGRVVAVAYRGPAGLATRPIQPVGIYAEHGYWYAPAYCFVREAMRVFRVDRVEGVEAVDHPAPRHDVAALTLANYYERFVKPQAEWLPLAVRLTAEGVRQLGDEPPVQINPDGSGWLESRLERADLDLFAERFGRWGADAVVEEPPELRQRIRERAAELMRLYGDREGAAPADKAPQPARTDHAKEGAT